MINLIFTCQEIDCHRITTDNYFNVKSALAMKKFIILLVVLFAGAGIIAQAPQKFSYQCVVRNTSNELVANHAVGIRATVLQGSQTGTVVYQETFNTLTNGNGLATIEIGSGTPVTGNFPSINWASGTYYLRTETDPAGGTNYTISGTNQLISVPYALHAKNAASYSETDPVFGAAPAKNITSGNITNWNTAYSWGNHAGLYRPAGWVPAWNDVGGKPVFATVATSGNYNDLINKPTIVNSPWTTTGFTIHYTKGNVGIGMSDPLYYPLTIYNPYSSYITFYNSTSGTGLNDGFQIGTTHQGSPVWIWNCENSNMHFGTNNETRMIIHGDGHVEMTRSLDLNTDSNFGALHVQGKQALWWDGTYFSWGYDAVWNYFARKVSIGRAADPGSNMLYVQGSAFATGTWNSSDASFKKNISTIGNSLDRLMKVRGTRFEFRTDEFKDYHFTKGPQYGFIAQELEKEFPEVVRTEGDGYKSVNYNGMIPVVLEAIKEQQKQIENQQKQIDELKMAFELMRKTE